jgi:hypothetical protein
VIRGDIAGQPIVLRVLRTRFKSELRFYLRQSRVAKAKADLSPGSANVEGAFGLGNSLSSIVAGTFRIADEQDTIHFVR